MKTDTTPQPRAIRVIGLSFVIAGLTTGALLVAQQPASPPPAVAEPAAAAEPASGGPAALPAPAGIAPAPAPPAPVAATPEPPPSVPPVAAVPPTPAAPGAGIAPSASVGGPARAVSGRASASISSEARSARRNAPVATPRKRIQNLARNAVDEELGANPEEIMRNYEAMIAEFDSQREDAARAILRLGEAYRKAGRFEEARVQYSRILREFVDFPELARLSQQQLAQSAQTSATSVGAPNILPPASTEERGLLEEELALLDVQLRRAQELVKTGVAPDSSLFSIQRDMLHIKQQLARLSAATRKGTSSMSSPRSSNRDSSTPARTPASSDATPVTPATTTDPAGARR